MKRHRLDLVSLLGGLLFMGLGLAFLFDALDKWSADVTWVPPIVLMVLGLAGVLSTVGRRSARDLDVVDLATNVPAEPSAPSVDPDTTPTPSNAND